MGQQRLLTVIAASSVLAALILVILLEAGPSNGPPVEALESTSTSVVSTLPTTTAATDTTLLEAADGRRPSNVPMEKLAPGEKPPQFIVFSFDGTGSTTKLRDYMAIADATGAQFVGFFTGLYLLDDANATYYTPPGGTPGGSTVGFGGDRDAIVDRVETLNEFYLAGNEVGTHYNGHICHLGAEWTEAQWNDEMDQFFDLFENWATINGYTDVPDFVVPRTEVKGGRTPCLAHQWNEVVPAWKSQGMTYDSSETNSGGLEWPERRDGLWQFPLPYIYSPGLGQSVIAMDYNIWKEFNGNAEDPSTTDELRQITLDTYRFLYEEALNGNRAPIQVAGHFNNWNGNAFNPAVADFMRETCGQPDTICTTYQNLIAWMEYQDPDVLQALLDSAPVAKSGRSTP